MTDPVASLKYRWAIENQWKLILPRHARMPDDKVELFDIVNDPHETNNLAAAHADVVNRLTKKINNWWTVD